MDKIIELDFTANKAFHQAGFQCERLRGPEGPVGPQGTLVVGTLEVPVNRVGPQGTLAESRVDLRSEHPVH